MDFLSRSEMSLRGDSSHYVTPVLITYNWRPQLIFLLVYDLYFLWMILYMWLSNILYQMWLMASVYPCICASVCLCLIQDRPSKVSNITFAHLIAILRYIEAKFDFNNFILTFLLSFKYSIDKKSDNFKQNWWHYNFAIVHI